MSIVINDGKATSDRKGQGQNAVEFAKVLEQNYVQLTVKHMRPGGLLNSVGA